MLQVRDSSLFPRSCNFPATEPTPAQSEAIVRYMGLKEPVDLSTWEAVGAFQESDF